MSKNLRINIDNYLKKLSENQEFMGGVLIAQGDNIVISKGYGMTNLDLDIANTTTTKFCIGSITKSITGMSIAILADEKKLSVKDTLDKYIPDYPKGDKITIYHMLTHTSGICDLYKDIESEMFGYEKNALEEIISKYKHKPLDFEPGAKFQYSNFAYNILAYIIENVSGETYENFINENIFEKLSMKDTGCYRNEYILKNKANGYSKSEERIINTKILNLSNLMGSGNLYSTVEDMFIWTQALKKRELLSKEYSERLFTDYIHVEGNYYYGYGFVVYKPGDEIEYIYQDGGLPGFRAIYKLNPKNGLTIIILSNCEYTSCFKIIEGIEQFFQV
jgi:CubicO group peptidase (beta-lactamase class C family)